MRFGTGALGITTVVSSREERRPCIPRAGQGPEYYNVTFCVPTSHGAPTFGGLNGLCARFPLLLHIRVSTPLRISAGADFTLASEAAGNHRVGR